MTALLLALSLAAAPFPARCRAVLAKAEQVQPGELHAVLLTLEPPLVDGQPGALPSLDAAIDALNATPDPATRAQALAALRALCSQAELAPGAPAPRDTRALAELLARPQFAQRRGQSWALGRVLERLWDVLKELLQQRAVKSYSNVARALFLVAVALLAAFLARRIWRGRKRELQAAVAAAQLERRSREAPLEELLAEARAALTRGDAREAVRGEMRAVLRALAESGFADRRGAATNREVARALADKGDRELARLTSDLASRFDQAIYGGAALDLAAATKFAEEAAAVRARLGAPA